MIVKTRKLDATDTEPDRIKVTAEDGAEGVFPYPYREGLDGREAHAWAVRRLFSGDEFGEPVWRAENGSRGEIFRVPGGEALAERDKVAAKDPRVAVEDRRAAMRRHNKRQAEGAPMGRAAVNTIARDALGRHMTGTETDRAEEARLKLTGNVSGEEQREAFRLGALEFKGDVTTHVGGDLIEAYDAGREFMHRVTDRKHETA